MKIIQLILRRLEVKICRRKDVYKYEIQKTENITQKWKLVRVPKRIYCSNVSPLVAVSKWAKNALFILLDLGKRAENAFFNT